MKISTKTLTITLTTQVWITKLFLPQKTKITCDQFAIPSYNRTIVEMKFLLCMANLHNKTSNTLL